MEYLELLLELEEPARRLSSGINAVGIMAMGLTQAKDPYADGFFAIWNYLVDADRDFQKQVENCLSTCSEGER